MIENARFTGKAKGVLELEFSGTPAQFILEMEALNGDIFDSRDMGDAMGFLFHYLVTSADYELQIDRESYSLYAVLHLENFTWESVPIHFGINLDSLPPSP